MTTRLQLDPALVRRARTLVPDGDTFEAWLAVHLSCQLEQLLTRANPEHPISVRKFPQTRLPVDREYLAWRAELLR